MGLLTFFKNQIRIRRNGQIKADTHEVSQLSKGYQSDYTEKRIRKLNKRIGQNEERNKIASENNLKSKSKSTTNNVTYNTSNTMNNGINTHVDFRKTKKSKKK